MNQKREASEQVSEWRWKDWWISEKKARIDAKKLCEGELVISDPALRKCIDDYEFGIRDDVRRKYGQIGPCQPNAHDFPRTQFGSAKWCC